jgi:hypothetical protein
MLQRIVWQILLVSSTSYIMGPGSGMRLLDSEGRMDGCICYIAVTFSKNNMQEVFAKCFYSSLWFFGVGSLSLKSKIATKRISRSAPIKLIDSRETSPTTS